uniref:Adipokinetic hormone n=1 Tax=Grapholita molesta TaxID=192188 RepID=A0A7D7Q0X9_GRAMO|nr:adipokinetic hormone [Grapholita molesta]
MYKFCLLLVLVACACVLTEAQLTFTSSWGGGKRSAGPNPCRSDESVGQIYRMIQAEAERLLLCQKP